MILLVNCSNCNTQLQVPLGGFSAVTCVFCQTSIHMDMAYQFCRPAATHYSINYTAPPLPYYSGYCQYNGYQHPTPSLAQWPFQALTPFHRIPLAQPPPSYGRKKAVIIGICYRNTQGELPGCINDAKCMEYMLTTRFNFPQDSIYMLTDDDTHPMGKPTRKNIISAMSWLVQGCQFGDSLVFYFSGHGGNQKNYTGDEIDGYDETLVPLDHKTEGEILDDEINDILVRPLPLGVKLHAVIDACHSGTVMDLTQVCKLDRTGRYSWEDHSPKSGLWKGTSGGEVISFSACDDHQSSIDTKDLSKDAYTGAMTYSFINAIINNEGATYGTLLSSMRTMIRDFQNQHRGDMMSRLRAMPLTSGSNSGIITQMKEHQVPTQMQEHQEPSKIQEPQLTANGQFPVFTKPFAL